MSSKIVKDPVAIDAILMNQREDQSVAWLNDWPNVDGHQRWLLQVSDNKNGSYDIPLEVIPLRALPGHFVLRLHMLGISSNPETVRSLLRGLQHCLGAQRGAIRLETYLVCNSESRREEFESILRELEFKEEIGGCFPATYRDSVVIDISQKEDEIFSGLSRSAKRNIKLVERRPVRLLRLEDDAYADRLQYLWLQTLGRKGASPQELPWKEYLDFSRAHPDRSAIFGLASTEGPFEANSILSFTFVTRSGKYGRTEESATASNSTARIGLAHAPRWKAILWAKQTGATWYDLTGTKRNVPSGDPMSGVSEFKRQFGGKEFQVRSDWSWTLRPRLYLTARTISIAMNRVRNIKRKLLYRA